MDLSSFIDQGFNLLRGDGGGSNLIQSVLLMMIWLSVRSLKKMLEKLEVNHDTRIGKLETKSEKHEGQLMVLESYRGKM